MISQDAAITPAQPTPAFAAGGLAAPNTPPPGALPEEVADDVDAKLSQGEYVIPADVVRFMGLEQIEKIVGKAKQGLMAMHEQGRIQAPGGATPPDAAQSLAGAPPAPAPSTPAPAPQDAPSPTPSFATGGMVGDLYSKTYNDYQKQAGHMAPTIETYTDENGRLAYRYVDANGKPVAQPKVTSGGFAGNGSTGTGTTPTTPTTPTPPIAAPAPVAPGLATSKGGTGGGDGDNNSPGHGSGLGGTDSSDPRDNPGNFSGGFSDFMDGVEGGVSMVTGGLPGMAAGAYGFATEGKPMSVDQALNHAFGIGLPNLGIENWVADQVDQMTGFAQKSTDPNYTGKAPETIMEDGSRIRWSQPTVALNESRGSGSSSGGYTDDAGGSYNADGTYTDAKGKTSAVGPASAVENYTRDKQAMPDAVASRAGLASAEVGGTNYGGPSAGPNSISDRGAMSASDLRDSYAASQASTSKSTGTTESTGGWGFGGFGGWGGYTSDSPGTSGGGGGADGNNGAGGSSDSRVICTYFYAKGELPRDLWAGDTRWTMEHVSLHTQRGYHIWGIPYVRLMRRSKLAETIMRPLALHRAEEIGYKLGLRDKPSFKGKIGRVILEGISWLAGFCPVVPESYKNLYDK